MAVRKAAEDDGPSHIVDGDDSERVADAIESLASSVAVIAADREEVRSAHLQANETLVMLRAINDRTQRMEVEFLSLKRTVIGEGDGNTGLGPRVAATERALTTLTTAMATNAAEQIKAKTAIVVALIAAGAGLLGAILHYAAK